jgi:leucyl-tRNA synthetase
MSAKYDHKAIEKKWQQCWEDTKAYVASEDSQKEKNYLLVEFPYPSGEGLHVGHVRSWTALDVVARKRRAQGKNVLYPIGWDAFGLPAENYAIKTGIHPTLTTKQNTDNFRRQIKSIGISFDWSREINTTDPKYYKWTQWIFLQLFKHNLAYKAKIPVNWCPKDKIVLANEEVVDGCCERCGTPVEKREKEQWMLAITKYAKRLYDDLDTVDYIERAKTQQKNWIGPSEGAEIDFEISGLTKSRITVFTTRPDTLFGATYMVLAPEHPFVQACLENKALENAGEVAAYAQEAKKKSEIDRGAEGKEKTGVELKGIKAINPATREEIPMFIADYVLGNYGTGAIMAVPAHDERDYAFAKKFNVPIKKVLEPEFVGVSGEEALKQDKPIIKREAVAVVVHNPKDDTYLCISWKGVLMHGLVTGGIEEGEDIVETAKREVREETGYKNLRAVEAPELVINTFFWHRVKQQNRHARFHYVFLELEGDERDAVEEKEATLHEVVWKKKEELKSFFTVFEGDYIANIIENPAYLYTGPGFLFNSGKFDGLESEEAKKKITEAVGGKWVVTYKLRDWVFSRQRYWGEPIPMIYCKKDGWVPVPEEDLPVELPQVEKYQPTDTGESPLASMDAWVNTVCPACGGPAKRETDVMPNWAGSSWYYLRYADPANDTEFASRKKLDYWTPVDWYNGGMEHTVLHLLYSRFWHKFLYDIKLVPTPEPYKKRTSHGLILAEGGEKMSKSKGNTVSPDTIVEQFGADSLRLYEMFLGPFDQPVAWNTSAIVGVRRFLERVWKLEEKAENLDFVSPDIGTLLHQTIKKVGEDIENLKMNTAVSSLMILLNALEDAPALPKSVYKIFLQLLCPFAPHIASELFERLGETSPIYVADWPDFDESKITAATATVAVQINGKTRATVMIAPEAGEEEALQAARSEPAVAKWLALGKEERAVYVPGKVISFVVH